jgi:lipopolysaccharide biosynthesis regulator YciM
MQPPQNPKPRAGTSAALPSFDAPLQNEEDILEQLVTTLSRGQLPEETWGELHEAARRDDRLSELAFAYESVSQGKRIKTLLPTPLAEFYFRAAQFFGDVFGDDVGAAAYLERAVATYPAHAGAFEALDALFTRADANKKLADLCATVAPHKPKPEQAVLLRRAAVLYERAQMDDKAIEMYQALLRAEPGSLAARDALEARYVHANRYRDVARLLETTLAADPDPDPEDALAVRGRLIEVYANQLQEPERTIGHVEAVLARDPTHEGALRMGERLLGVKALAARAAAALGSAVIAMGRAEDAIPYIEVELENIRGPKRKEPLKRLGMIRKDTLDDKPGAYESFEAVLGIDPSDDEVRLAFFGLAVDLGKAADAARTLGRVLTMAKDAAARSKISSELADLLRLSGDAKRARATHAGVIALAGAAPEALLRSARALAELFEAEGDQRALAEMLEKVGSLSTDPEERLRTNERLAELATGPLADPDKAIAAWKNLVDSSARPRALAALEPLYTQAENWAELAFVLGERSKDEPDVSESKALAMRSADMFAQKTAEKERATNILLDLLGRFGPDREVNARLAPLLEAQKRWDDLGTILQAEARLADDREGAVALARLGTLRATRLQDTAGAIVAYRDALDRDPNEKGSRAALERLLGSPDHKMDVADVLEPVYRADLLRGDTQAATGLLRILELRADSLPIVSDRLEALGEAVSIAEKVSLERALELAGRALAEAVASDESVEEWLLRTVAVADRGVEPKRLAAALSSAIGIKDIATAHELMVVTRAAEAHAAAGEVARALTLYRKALAFAPQSSELVTRVDELLQEQGNPQERVTLYRNSLEQGVEPARRKQLLVAIGTIERSELGNKPAAVQAFRAVLGQDPTDRPAYKALAELYAELGQWETLCDLYEDHLEHADEDEARATRADLALTAAQHAQNDRAIMHAFALLKDPQLSDEGFGTVAKVADTLADAELQRAVLERVVAVGSDPLDRIDALERLGDLALTRSDDRAQAMEHWKQAADTALGMSQDARARELFERAQKLDPNDVEIARALVEILSRYEEWAEALPLYDVLLAHAADPRTKVDLLITVVGIREERLGDPVGALDAAATAFSLAPTDHNVLLMFERVAGQAGALSRFASQVDQALDQGLDPHSASDVRLAKARVLSRDPQFKDSVIETYRRILETPGADDARIDTAAIALEEMLESPRAGLEKSTRRWLSEWKVGRAAEDAKALALLSWGQVEEEILGDSRRALDVYRRALSLDPQNVDATAAIARLSIAQGDVDGAVVALVAQRELLEGSAKSGVELELATILLDRQERAVEAMGYVADVVERSPGDARALGLAARLLGYRDTRARAVQVLERALDGAEDPAARASILEKLVGSEVSVAEDTRFEWYQRLIDLHKEGGKSADAFAAVLAAARAMPHRMTLWDKAEELARELESPDPVAELYEHALSVVEDREQALEFGQRAVAFYEEWYEASDRVVTILKRVLEIDPSDLWAFDRLKLVFDAGERWSDLFELYDRAIAAAADDATKVQLLEDVAQIAKDFANSADRSISYFEQLLALKPGNARLAAALERLYEKNSRPRELIALLSSRISDTDAVAAQETRAKIAKIWLDDVGDATSALGVVEDIVLRAQDADAKDAKVDVIALLERTLAVAPVMSEAQSTESLQPPPTVQGRRDSLPPMVSPKRPLVRQRAAALLKEKYSVPGREADLARMLEVELEAIKSPKERIRRHLQLAELYEVLTQDERALLHRVDLVLLDPENEDYQTKLSQLSRTLGKLDEYAAVLVRAGEATDSEELRVDLFMRAAAVLAEREADRDRAIELMFRVLGTPQITEGRLLEACRFIEPLLFAAERKHERLEVLERLSMLESEFSVKGNVLGEAARLATELADFDRGIWAWEGRLEIEQNDVEALSGLVDLFERTSKWREMILARKRRAAADVPEDQKRKDRMRVATVLSDELGELAESISAWRDFESEFGETDESTEALRNLYRRTSQWPELCSLLYRASGRTEDPFQAASLLRELGDLRREHLNDAALAVTAYENALRADAGNDGSRAGLLALIDQGDQKKDAVRVLLASYRATEDLPGVLSLTEPRLAVASTKDERVEILREAAQISEATKEDKAAAFDYLTRALRADPTSRPTEDDLYRLSTDLGNETALAALLTQITADLDQGGDSPAFLAGVRFRLATLLEKTLGQDQAALVAYVRVCESAPGDLEAARATIRVAGRVSDWAAAARALADYARSFGALELSLAGTFEEAATLAHGWDPATRALTEHVAREKDALGSAILRDIEASIAGWHRDRRGDPDAAEAAYTRALGHDPLNAELLAALAQLQRRAKGRPLVESLLRLSQATGGDLDLLAEAADIALHNVLDRALAKSIFDKLLKLATERWQKAPEGVSTGSPGSPSTFVDRALKSLVGIYDDEGDVERVATLLIETAKLPFPREATREMRLRAAEISSTRLLDPERAIAIYLVLFEEDRRDDEVIKKLSALYESTGRKDELIGLRLQQIDASESEDSKLSLRIDVSSIQYSLGNVSDVITTLRENLSQRPRHERTITRLAEIYDRESRDVELEGFHFEQGEAAEAAGDTETATRYFLLAAKVAETKRKDLRAATAHLRRVIGIGTSRDALEALARIAMTLGAPLDAAGYLDRLRELALPDERPEVTLKLADAFLSAGDTENAKARLEDEIARSPAADPVRTRLVSIYKAQKEWKLLADLLIGGAHHAHDKATKLLRLREAADLLVSRCGSPDTAIPLLESARDLDPDDRTIQLSLADALGAAKRFDDARTLLRGMIDAFSGRRPKERAPVHYHLARLDLAIGDRARALVELDAATKIDPANPEILRALSELARDDGQLERAERSYRALLTVLRRQDDTKEDPPIVKTEVLLELAQIAERQGESDRAKEILESAMEMATESDNESKRLEAVLRSRGDYLHFSRALERRLARSKEDGSFAENLSELADIYEAHLGKSDEATAARLRAVRMAPYSAPIHDKARAKMKARGTLQAYVDLLSDLAGSAEDNGQADMAAGLLARKAAVLDEDLDEPKQAIRIYEAALMLKSDSPEVLAALGNIFGRIGDTEGQARILGSFVESERSQGRIPSDALYRLAALRLSSEDTIAEGCTALEQAYEESPDADRAISILREASNKTPQNESIVDLYERIAKQRGDRRALVDALARRWAAGDGAVGALREAYDVATDLLDTDLAESLLRRFLERGTEDLVARAWALTNLSIMREQNKDFAEAVLLRREAAEISDPGEARALLFEVAAIAETKLADIHLAATVLEDLHERDAADRDAWAPLLDIYRKRGDHEKLSNLLGEVIAFADDAEERTTMRLERVKVGMDKLGLADLALPQLQEILDEDPGHAEAAMMLGTLLEKGGRDADLVTLYEKQLDAAKDKENAAGVVSISQKLGALLEKRDRDAAKSVYYACLDWAADNADVIRALVRMHTAGGAAEMQERADMTERLLALVSDKEAETTALALADLRTELGDADAAIRALELGFTKAGQSPALFAKLETLYKEKSESSKLADLYLEDAKKADRTDAERASRLHAAARLYLNDVGDAARGAQLLSEARVLAPTDASLLSELVTALTTAGDLGRAIDELGTAIDALPVGDAQRLALVAQRAELRRDKGDLDAALVDFDEAATSGTSAHKQALLEHVKAMSAAAGADNGPATRALRLRLATLLRESGDVDGARSALTDLIRTDSRDKVVLRAAGLLEEETAQWNAAIAVYRRLVGFEDPENIADTAKRLLYCCEQAGRMADARGGLERARIAVPENKELRAALERVYEATGATAELAGLALDEAQTTGDVGGKFALLVKAGSLFVQDPQNTERAIAPLEEARSLRPGDLDCVAILADAYTATGKLTEAMEVLTACVATFKGRRARELSAIYHRIARVAEAQGDRDAELANLTLALDVDAQNGVAASELAYIAMELAQWELATRALRAVTMLKSPAPLSKALAYQHLGEIAKQQGDVKKALVLVKRAVDEDATLASAKDLLEIWKTEV